MTLFLYNYNNYYNRVVKGSVYYEDYGTPIGAQANVEFNPADGVHTTIILNTSAANADYLLVIDEDETINSRWFVMETRRKRAGQYEFVLYRDTVYDYLDSIKTAPIFIEKATLGVNNPLIYNTELVGVNQIKTNETLLKDEFGTPWIVAYIKEDQSAIDVSIPDEDLVADITVNGLASYEYNAYTTQTFAAPAVAPIFAIRGWYSILGIDKTYWFGWDRNGNQAFFPEGYKDGNQTFTYKDKEAHGIKIATVFAGNAPEDAIVALTQDPKYRWDVDVNAYISEAHTQFATNQFLQQNGKIIFDSSTNKYYKIRVGKTGVKTFTGEIPDLSIVGQQMVEIATAAKIGNNNLFNVDDRVDNPYVVSATCILYNLYYDELPQAGITMKIPANSLRVNCKDQPYDILAFPADSFTATGIDKGSKTSRQIANQMAEALIKTLSSNLIDIQLLPYCPLPEYVDGKARIDVSSLVLEQETTQRARVLFWEKVQPVDTDNIYGAAFFLTTGDFTATIPNVSIAEPRNAIECKVMNETKMYRFVSPNYNGIFEINPAKNKGIKNIKADLTYKPFYPYIRVYPEFNGLYGSNYGDCRGLICGGDFSLPQVQDRWMEYQLQNKNYQVMFDRQITNLERNNKLNMTEAGIGVFTGAVGAGLTGAAFGYSLGGPMAAGLGIGASAVSLLGGLADIAILQQRQRETMDYTKDMYLYNLQNIQAMPDNIVKFSSFNINNKIFPILEEYSATDEEVEQLKNKIKYNGMTVMTIGKLEDYIQPTESYIKGKIIRLDDIAEDYHVATVIAEELNKGVFI